jgi:O-antigen/teichoic acid export membrane protein
VAAEVNQRRALVMADQGVSGLSNVVVSIFVARSLPDAGFGAFGVAAIVAMLTLGVSRALIGEPLLSRFSRVTAAARRRLVPDMLGAALVVSAAAALAVGVAGLALGGDAGAALVVLAFVLPLIVVQDTWRYAFIVDRPAAALAVDLVWLGGVFVALPLAPSGAEAPWYVAAWGLTAGVGAVWGQMLGRRAVVHVPHPFRWLRDNGDMGVRFLGEFATGQAVGQSVLLGVGAIAGLAVLGAVRAAQTFFGPINTIHAGIFLALVPEGARARDEPVRLRRLMLAASGLLAAVAVGWTVVGLALPASAGAELFGASWADASDLIGPMGPAMIAGSLATGGFAGLRALGAARASLRARLETAPPQLVLPLGGTAVAASGGYVVGYGLAHAASAAIYWTEFLRALRFASTRHGVVDDLTRVPVRSA